MEANQTLRVVQEDASLFSSPAAAMVSGVSALNSLLGAAPSSSSSSSSPTAAAAAVSPSLQASSASSTLAAIIARGGVRRRRPPPCRAARLCVSAIRPLFRYYLHLPHHRSQHILVLERAVNEYTQAAREILASAAAPTSQSSSSTLSSSSSLALSSAQSSSGLFSGFVLYNAPYLKAYTNTSVPPADAAGAYNAHQPHNASNPLTDSMMCDYRGKSIMMRYTWLKHIAHVMLCVPCLHDKHDLHFLINLVMPLSSLHHRNSVHVWRLPAPPAMAGRGGG